MEALRAKIGPLETWVWLALITALRLGWYLYEKNKSGSASTAAGTAQVPETVNEVQVTNQPPTPPSDAAALAAEQALEKKTAAEAAAEGKTIAQQKKEINTLEQDEKKEDKKPTHHPTHHKTRRQHKPGFPPGTYGHPGGGSAPPPRTMVRTGGTG